MKVLFIVHDYLPNFATGTEIHTRNMAREAIANGHEAYVFAMEPFSKEFEDGFVEMYTDDDGIVVYKVHKKNFSHLTNLEQTYFHHETDEQFSKVLDGVKPDIVHVQNLLNHSLSYIDIVKKRNIRLVYTILDLWFKCPTIRAFIDGNPCPCNSKRSCGLCSGLVINGGYSLEKISNPVVKFLARVDWYLQRRKRASQFKAYFKKVDQFIIPSRFLWNEVSEFLGTDKNFTQIELGIDLKDTHAKKKERDPKNIKILFPAHLTISKGLGEVVKALEKVQETHSNYTFAAAGSYTENDAEVQSFIDRLEKVKNSAYIGKYLPEKRTELFSEYDIIMVPSQWEEAYSLVLDEALALERFLIVSNKGALPERVIPGVTGEIFTAGKPETLVKVITNILDNPGILEKATSEDFKVHLHPVQKTGRMSVELYEKLLRGE